MLHSLLPALFLIVYNVPPSECFLPPLVFDSFRKRQLLSTLRFFGVSQGNYYEDDLDNFGEDLGWSQSTSRNRYLEHKSESPMSSVRRQRLEREQDRKTRFLSGDDLQDLRQQVFDLRLEWSTCPSQARKLELEQAIYRAQQMDAEFIYQVAKQRAEAAESIGAHGEAARLRQEAEHARAALPQFNLEGLWVGKYGDHGFELVNVTYIGDTLFATKVTGDHNVPKGQLSFQVDLSPKRTLGLRAMGAVSDFEHLSSVSQEESEEIEIYSERPLEPIELNQEAAQQWGSRYLQRFHGMGQVASSGFRNAQWMDGQLILVGASYFSFSWLQIEHQVFFGRPSAEMTLKLLRESSNDENVPMAQERQHLTRCWEETELMEDDLEASDGLFVSHSQQVYYTMEGCFE